MTHFVLQPLEPSNLVDEFHPEADQPLLLILTYPAVNDEPG